MHIYTSIFLIWGSTGISLHDLQFKKTLYLTHIDPLCSPSVQPLSETGPFSSCLFKAPLLRSPLCSDWPALGSCPFNRLLPDAEATSTNNATNYSSRIAQLFLVLYAKCKPLKYIRTCSSRNLIRNMRVDDANSTWKNLSNHLSNQGYGTDGCL